MEVPWNVAPRAAAKDTICAVSGCPSRAVCGGAAIAIVIAILCPFPNIAMNLIKTPRIGLEAINRHGLLPVFPFLAAALVRLRATVVIGLLRRDRGTPPKWRCGSRPCHILTL